MIYLIINKDMPSSCRECFRNRQCPQWNRRSLWKKEYIYKRSDNCPLHEIKPQAERKTRKEMNKKLKCFITCMKCEVSGKCCDENCPTQYEAGHVGDIIENLEAISKELEIIDKHKVENDKNAKTEVYHGTDKDYEE